MAIRNVQLGSPRLRGEGLRIGVVRRPPRGVRKSEYAARNYYDVWVPMLSPSPALLKIAQPSKATEKSWRAFTRRFRAEIGRRPEARALLDLLAALSKQTNFSIGCYCRQGDKCHRLLLLELLRERGAAIS
jgi:uncharacterized protein YeaO (DUF488 family)